MAEDANEDWPMEEPLAQDSRRCVEVVVEVAPNVCVEEDGTEAHVMVSVQTPDTMERHATDLCCVVDISGSMGNLVTYDTDGVERSDGLTTLDVVKHAVKTVMHMLTENDRLALVVFDDKAEIVFPLTAMTEVGRKDCMQLSDQLAPRGQTNLWEGVLAGLETLRSDGTDKVGRHKTLLLLTDGKPTISPPFGHVRELQRYLETHPGCELQINTFGFGYDLDSELLLDLALEGHGTYAFIPDAHIVGTVFVNCVANVLSTFAQNASLHLMPQGGAEFAGDVVGSLKVSNASWGRVVSLGPLQYGQSREIVVPMRLNPGSEPYLEVVINNPYGGSGEETRVSTAATSREACQRATTAAIRCQATKVISAAITAAAAGQGRSAQQSVVALASRTDFCGDGALQALKADIDGRACKALKGKERFNRWGKHYLRALMRSHELHLCTNFMDPGLQVYGGSLFRCLRADGDRVFLSLPAPTPSRSPTVISALPPHSPPPPAVAIPPAATASPPPPMNRYYAGSGGGCFGGSSTVLVASADSQVRMLPVAMVKPGDQVCIADGGFATVRCVVQIYRSFSKGLIEGPGGLSITGGHPVRMLGEWRRPRDIWQATSWHDGVVYNFILDKCHVLLVSGVECVTWGHGIAGEIVEHSYFGTAHVIRDLARLGGWEKGLVRVEGFHTDSRGQVIGVRGWHGASSSVAEAADATEQAGRAAFGIAAECVVKKKHSMEFFAQAPIIVH
eukprot:TRINITY_DN21530_c0_g1_i1.p1 TRINITY_DN21530_c0_g1~~TRINITY_DN21530_c0_g1_i1.p1  ORF type:complete len:759 (+),score=83.32 TRINITY_DN21530_c0_g1_i1:78-2279(+)